MHKNDKRKYEAGHALVVRNGKAESRQVMLGAGTVEITGPRVNDRRVAADGTRQRFTSAILPPYMRRSPKVAEVLPILYLRGLSTGDFQEATEGAARGRSGRAVAGEHQQAAVRLGRRIRALPETRSQ
jgi:hypothetical protein